MKNLETNLNPIELSKNPEECKRFLIALKIMENYSIYSRWQIDKMNYDYSNLDKKFLNKMTYDYKIRVKLLENAINNNQLFLNEIVKKYKPTHSFYENYNQKEICDFAYNEFSNLNYEVFRHIIREWTLNGKEERDTNYIPIIENVKKYISPHSKILIPGAGLLRLGYELAKIGYNIDANDNIFLNVILCDYLFNYSKMNQLLFQPLIRSFRNYLTEDEVFTKFSFPDENINLDGKGKITMLGGDFIKLYKDKNSIYDCVITCFFIDRVNNVFEYIDIIEKVLKKGGIWINFGPLRFQFTCYQNIPIIQLPYDKLKEVIIKFGFEFIHEEKNKTVIYCGIKNYMKNDVFNCVFFTVRKK